MNYSTKVSKVGYNTWDTNLYLLSMYYYPFFSSHSMRHQGSGLHYLIDSCAGKFI